MQIVTNIPDGIYYFLMEHPDRQFPYATEWIRQGTPLPKGHGRLIDADALIYKHTVETDAASLWAITRIGIEAAPTIIEGDK